MQVVEYLPRKPEALSSNSSTAKKRRKENDTVISKQADPRQLSTIVFLFPYFQLVFSQHFSDLRPYNFMHSKT
jgi:hypothetical protein